MSSIRALLDFAAGRVLAEVAPDPAMHARILRVAGAIRNSGWPAEVAAARAAGRPIAAAEEMLLVVVDALDGIDP